MRLRDPNNEELMKIDTLNSSLMNYEQMDSSISIEKIKRQNKRNLTAIRHHIENYNIEDDSAIYRHGKDFQLLNYL